MTPADWLNDFSMTPMIGFVIDFEIPKIRYLFLQPVGNFQARPNWRILYLYAVTVHIVNKGD